MVALGVYESTLCPKCGRPLSVCTDPANEFKFKTGAPTRCHATTSQVIAAEKSAGIAHSEGVLFHTELVD